LPAPDAAFEREWVELYNPGVAPVALAGWRLDDSVDGGGQPLDEVALSPGAYLVVEIARPILNNSGDTARLLGPDGGLVDAVSFEQLPPDRSLSRDAQTGAWISDTLPSPGAAYERPAPSTSPLADDQGSAAIASALPVSSAATGLEVAAAKASPTPARLPQAAGGVLAQALPRANGPRGQPYALATATPFVPPLAVQAQAPAPAPANDGPVLPWWLALVGLGLITLACALLVTDRAAIAPEVVEDGVL